VGCAVPNCFRSRSNRFKREEHWVIADLVGKGGHVRTFPIPTWVKSHVDAWDRRGEHHARAGVPRHQ
jgi:hypothetical protein